MAAVEEDLLGMLPRTRIAEVGVVEVVVVEVEVTVEEMTEGAVRTACSAFFTIVLYCGSTVVTTSEISLCIFQGQYFVNDVCVVK